MKLQYRRCAGLDIHKESISACVRLRIKGSREVQIEGGVFGTFTRDLERLRNWLKQHRVKQVALEPTGVYWVSVWNVSELYGNPSTARRHRPLCPGVSRRQPRSSR
jgi:transposase